MECPACGGKRHETIKTQVYRCRRCGAIHGTCYLGESYELVLPFWATEEPPAERICHFDLTCLGSEGITRRHGWYDTETRRVVQTG